MSRVASEVADQLKTYDLRKLAISGKSRAFLKYFVNAVSENSFLLATRPRHLQILFVWQLF